MVSNLPKKSNKKSSESIKGPVFLIKPASKMAGLDYLHISLIILVIILIAVSFALASFKRGIIIQNNTQACANSISYQNQNITNSNAALRSVERLIGSYKNTNTSFDLLPFYTLVNESNVSYSPFTHLWTVVIPYIDPLYYYKKFYVVSVVNSSFYPKYIALSMPMPNLTSSSYVAAPGILAINTTPCSSTLPIPVDMISDPYGPYTINAIYQAINISKEYGNKINMNYFFIFSKYSDEMYSQYGINETQLMGKYLFCASKQSRFPAFMGNFTKVFSGTPLSNQMLYMIANASGLNMNNMNSCLSTSAKALADQEMLVSGIYKIIFTPSYVINCEYQTIPPFANRTINYSIQQYMIR
ncbi:MAG: hypothetical protein ACP5RP_00745 [Candidatus Micrarchaeia archaeon]